MCDCDGLCMGHPYVGEDGVTRLVYIDASYDNWRAGR